MRHRILILATLCTACASTCVIAAAKTEPVPLENPIADKIVKGDIVVKAIEFVRAPKTTDPHQRPTIQAGIDIPLHSSAAHARIVRR